MPSKLKVTLVLAGLFITSGLCLEAYNVERNIRESRRLRHACEKTKKLVTAARWNQTWARTLFDDNAPELIENLGKQTDVLCQNMQSELLWYRYNGGRHLQVNNIAPLPESLEPKLIRAQERCETMLGGTADQTLLNIGIDQQTIAHIKQSCRALENIKTDAIFFPKTTLQTWDACERVLVTLGGITKLAMIGTSVSDPE